MNQDQIELHAIVKGEVQGVGFRYTAQMYAQNIGLNGTVRNLPNGHVEIYVQGSKIAIDTFLKKLQKEAFLKEIDEIEVDYYSPKNSFNGFHILR